ncbi:hypothetical protein [Mycobacteroides abscessus]|uniref:hypothetical protein n=1 Tax=Mycobacteroides abscessus TaxID=36809 RepID=UPI001F44A662|nr:hypothetical protein [Mycobacteroides abscessus]
MVLRSPAGHSLRSGILGALKGKVLFCRKLRKWQVALSSIGHNIVDQLRVLDA